MKRKLKQYFNTRKSKGVTLDDLETLLKYSNKNDTIKLFKPQKDMITSDDPRIKKGSSGRHYFKIENQMLFIGLDNGEWEHMLMSYKDNKLYRNNNVGEVALAKRALSELKGLDLQELYLNGTNMPTPKFGIIK